MAVAIHQHQVVTADHRMPDDLVGGRGAVDHEIGVVGAEVAGGTLLGGRQRAGVVEQRPEFGHRHRQIGAQRVFPEELVKRLPHRTLAVGHPPAMARRMPGIVGLRGVLHQRLEERR